MRLEEKVLKAFRIFHEKIMKIGLGLESIFNRNEGT